MFRKDVLLRRTKIKKKNDSNIIVIDLKGVKKWRLINVYRSFAPQHNVTQRDKFVYQLGLIKQAFTTSSILLGDFNLDWQRRHYVSYSHKNYFSDMENLLGTLNLNQLVNFTTWTRTINGEVKQSTLDHIHLLDPFNVNDLNKTWTSFSDHCLISFSINQQKCNLKPTWRRDWRNNNQEALNARLNMENLDFKSDSVQAYWNELLNEPMELS